MTHRTYKFRCYPTAEQQRYLANVFGCARHAYNWSLRLRTDAYHNEQHTIGYPENCRLWTTRRNEETWLQDTPAVPMQQALRHLQRAFTSFFQDHTAYPKFKRKRGRQAATYVGSAFKWAEGRLRLAKLKTPLRVRQSRKVTGDPISVTVSRDPAHRYFVSFLVNVTIKKKQKRTREIGVDLGLNRFAVTSDGSEIPHPGHGHRCRKRLALLQRRFTKKKKDSKNREKARLKVARCYARIADARLDFLHKLSTKLINENQVICVESLAVKQMMQTRRLAYRIADSGWAEFVRQLRYKASWYGRTLVEIDRWFPSSKRCSSCGHIQHDLGAARTWTCPECNKSHDRDVNAAKNIRAVGHTVLARGDGVKPRSHSRAGSRRRSRNP